VAPIEAPRLAAVETVSVVEAVVLDPVVPLCP
jgi:hypothetical protein